MSWWFAVSASAGAFRSVLLNIRDMRMGNQSQPSVVLGWRDSNARRSHTLLDLGDVHAVMATNAPRTLASDHSCDHALELRTCRRIFIRIVELRPVPRPQHHRLLDVGQHHLS